MTKKKLFWTGITVLMIVIPVLAFVDVRVKKENDNVRLELKCFRSSGGWGYAIYVDHRMFIEQSFVPAIKEHIAFPSAAIAKRTGNLVMGKLMNGKSPALSVGDLAETGILTDLGLNE